MKVRVWMIQIVRAIRLLGPNFIFVSFTLHFGKYMYVVRFFYVGVGGCHKLIFSFAEEDECGNRMKHVG